MTLMPVSNISAVGVRSSRLGASWWMLRRCTSAGRSAPRSIGSPSGVESRPSSGSPTGTQHGAPLVDPPGHRDRRPRVDHLEPTCETVRRVHRDRTHTVIADVLLDLAHEHALPGDRADPGRLLLEVGLRAGDRDRVVDLGTTVGEDGLDHDALDL